MDSFIVLIAAVLLIALSFYASITADDYLGYILTVLSAFTSGFISCLYIFSSASKRKQK